MDKYEDYTFQVGSEHGYPVFSTITAEDQKDAAEHGLTLDDLIEMELDSFGDWQRDC